VSKLAWLFVLPGAMALVWGTFIAPKARIKPALLLRLALELGVFGAASCALAAMYGPTLGFSFLVVSTLSSWLNAATARRAR
jgi:hypothetical protein